MGGDTARGNDILELARLAEAGKFDSVWVVDHFLWNVPSLADFGSPLPDGKEGVKFGFWECWTLVSALAVATERVEIGTLVTNTGYRNPALLARIAETVDELCNGRLILGVGAGAVPSEYEAFGYDWDRRVGRFEEALSIISPLLRGEMVTFEGEFYRTKNAELKPKGPRLNGPPILIGLLHGGPRMKRLVTQYADQWNCWLAYSDSRIEAYRQAYEELMTACKQHGRDPETLEKNAALCVCLPGHRPSHPDAVPLTGSPGEIAEQLTPYLAATVDHLVISLKPTTRDGINVLSTILEELDESA